jgi:hypothetical protein
VAVQLPLSQGGGAGKAAYIDTGSLMCTAKLAEAGQLAVGTACKPIIICGGSWQQMLAQHAAVPLLKLQQQRLTKLLCAMSCWPAEGTFRPERIRAIAARFNLDTEAVLDNVCGRPAGAGPAGQCLACTGF